MTENDNSYSYSRFFNVGQLLPLFLPPKGAPIHQQIYLCICSIAACNKTSFTDLLLLVDSSSNISKAQFQRTISYILPELIIALKLSHSDIKVALASYHSEVNVLFDFSNCYTTDNIRSEVNKLSQGSQEGDTPKAITFSRDFFSRRYGARVNATKHVILFSNGNWSTTSDVIDAAEKMKDIRLSVVMTMTTEERNNDNVGQCLDNVLRIVRDPFDVVYIDEDDHSGNELSVLASTTRSVRCNVTDFN